MTIQRRFLRPLLLGAFCAPPLAWAQQVSTTPQYVAGSLVKAGNSVLTIRTTTGEERLVTANDQTRWVCADSLGRRIAFADLKPGIKLTASCDPATGAVNSDAWV
jgi:hypothetical protein